MSTISTLKLENRVDKLNDRFNKKFWIEHITGYTKKLYLRLNSGEDKLIIDATDRQSMWILLIGLKKGLEIQDVCQGKSNDQALP